MIIQKTDLHAVAGVILLLLLPIGVAAQPGGLPASLDVEYDLTQRYDPFDPQNSVTEFTIVADRAAARDDYFIEIEAASAGVLGFQAAQTVLNTQLRSPSSGTFAEGTVLRVMLPPTSEEAKADRTLIRLLVDAGQVAPPGSYEALLDIRLTNGADIAAELLAVPVPLLVEARAQVIIAGASGSFDPARSMSFIDFGELETGERRDLFAIIRANSQTRVTVSSINGGIMLQPQAPLLPGVPYSIEFDSIASTLDAPLVVTRSPAPTRSGTPYPFSVIVGDAEGKFAGEYLDEVNIEVAPQ